MRLGDDFSLREKAGVMLRGAELKIWMEGQRKWSEVRLVALVVVGFHLVFVQDRAAKLGLT